MSAVLKEIPTSTPVTQFLATPKRMLINGKWVPAASGKTFEVTNPATGNVIAHVAEGDKADIDAAVQAARRALESGPWATLTPSARGKMIFLMLAGVVQAGLFAVPALVCRLFGHERWLSCAVQVAAGLGKVCSHPKILIPLYREDQPDPTRPVESRHLPAQP